jgi:hypothetical protein
VPLSAPTAPRAGLRAGISSEGGPGPALASVEVFQTDDRYASPVLRGRYQVLASAIGTSFYVYDLHRADQIRTEAKDIRRFEKKSDAFAYLGFTIDEMKTMSLISAQDVEDTEKEIEMAKARVVTEAMAKAQASMEARIAAKRAKAAPVKAEKAEAPKVAKVAAPKAEKVKAAPTNGVAKGRGQAAMFRELIAANKMTDKEMLAEVRAAFPDKKVVESSVTFYRARM